jgi:2-oxoglutarate ferredoxin oxidoreductase subunit alpha
MAGSGGDGVVSAGESLIAAVAHDGYQAMMTKSFGPQIRGGESSCRVRISTEPVQNPGGVLDVALALNWEDFLKFGSELQVGPSSLVLYEAKTGVAPNNLPLSGVVPAQALAVPMADMAKEATGNDRARNSVVLGILSGYFGLAAESITRGIKKKLGKKGDELVAANIKAFELGVAYAAAHPLVRPLTMDPPRAAPGTRMLVDGNDMCASAAIFAGCQFFGGYPITPSTEVMQLLTREIWKYGGAVLQAEDEIAGIGAALGASFAGKKAMTATSGPGLSLKTEIMGLASIAELPLVIVDVQRGGPSTGIPTKAEQSDLFQACFSAHGDVARPVLAPTSAADTFPITVEAFNIAEHYQTPVLLLSDQEIAQRKEAVEPIDLSKLRVVDRVRPSEDQADYSRFAFTESGISPVSHPGMAGVAYLGSGIEHNEKGEPTASGAMHARMNDKRFKKLRPLMARTDLFRIEGDLDAPLALVSWGSSAGHCAEALAQARAAGLRVKMITPYLLYPVAEKIFERFFASVRAGLVVEMSHQGQYYRLLRMFVDLPPGIVSFCRSAGNPILASEIADRLTVMSEQRSAS